MNFAQVQRPDGDFVEQLITGDDPGLDVAGAEGNGLGSAGFLRFGDSSYDFDVEFDSPTAAFADFYDARHKVGVAIIRRLNEEGIELAYPTQTQIDAPPAADEHRSAST